MALSTNPTVVNVAYANWGPVTAGRTVQKVGTLTLQTSNSPASTGAQASPSSSVAPGIAVVWYDPATNTVNIDTVTV